MAASGWPTPSQIVVLKTSADSPYSVQQDDHLILANASGAPMVLNMLSAAGRWSAKYGVKKIDTSINSITINAVSGQSIDNQSSYILLTPLLSLTFVSDGSNWWVE